MRVIAILLAVAAALFVLVVYFDTGGMMGWAIEQQRVFQNYMALAVQDLRTGAPGAWGALLAAAGAYGFVHALGPGHGKYLISGVGLGSGVRAGPLIGLSVASSIAQALWAILLVYSGFWALEFSAQSVTALAEDVLARASYVAIAAVGAVLAWRGLAAMVREVSPVPASGPGHHHDDDTCGCGHAHGPSAQDVAGLTGWRDTVGLVASIAIRPCTGAIFLLVIAWQMQILWAGAAAVLVMGLGTAGLTSLVAVSSVAARRLALVSSGHLGSLSMAVPILQICAGGLIILASLTLLGLR